MLTQQISENQSHVVNWIHMLKTNVGILDRLLRATFSAILLLAGLFWFEAGLKFIAIIIAIILLITAIVGFCQVYTHYKTDTINFGHRIPKWAIILWIFGLFVLMFGGAYGANFFTKKAFMDDYNRMNNPYKQVLFQTGQGNAELAQSNLTEWQNEWSAFTNKYSSYRPWSIAMDKQFPADLAKVTEIQNTAATQIANQNFPESHLTLEQVRPVFNDMLKRNGFSLEAVALVDFHDAMEVVLDAANAKNGEEVLSSYVDADIKLKDVEAISNDEETQEIRSNLEVVKTSATENLDALPDLAAKLKSSYVKVYLKRG